MKKPHPQSSVAVTDANFLVEKGIPAINFGPGETIETAHAANEYLKIDDLTNVTKILASSILNWCGI